MSLLTNKVNSKQLVGDPCLTPQVEEMVTVLRIIFESLYAEAMVFIIAEPQPSFSISSSDAFQGTLS